MPGPVKGEMAHLMQMGGGFREGQRKSRDKQVKVVNSLSQDA